MVISVEIIYENGEVSISRLLYRLQAKPGGAESLCNTLQGLGGSQKTQNWKKARSSGHQPSFNYNRFQGSGSSEDISKTIPPRLVQGGI